MTGWIVETLVASALLMAVVLAVRGPVRRWFGPELAYALWALPALRLMLPPLPALGHHAPASSIGVAAERVGVLLLPVAAPVAPAATPLSTGGLLVALWAAGATLFLARQTLAHVRFVRRLLAEAVLLEVCGGVAILASPAATGPLAFGVWRRRVVVPRDWGFGSDERELAVAHELAHHARGDLLANWAALAVLALHWFDPIAWRAFRAFRADQEQATDARVLAGRAPGTAAAYGRAIVRAAAGSAISPACHLNTLTDLKRRLAMLAHPRPSRRRLAAGACATLALTLVGLAATAPGTPAAARVHAAAARVAPAMPAMPSMPAMPPMPAMPEMPAMAAQDAPTPPAPPAPPKPTTQARTIIVRPGKGEPITLVTRRGTDPLATVPAVVGLPQGFAVPDGCKADARIPPQAFVVRGKDERPYTVVCARSTSSRDPAAPPTERAAYQQALAALRTARVQIQQQTDIPEPERTKALAAIDQSTTELEGDLARAKAD